MKRRKAMIMLLAAVLLVVATMAGAKRTNRKSQFLGSAENNSQQLIDQGRQIFRFDTFGDEAFWGGQLHLQQAINTLTTSNALALFGLKVDSQALSPSLVEAIKHGQVNLDDPAVTRVPGGLPFGTIEPNRVRLVLKEKEQFGCYSVA